MRRPLWFVVIALLFGQSAAAQEPPNVVVPVAKAPFHVAAFSNEYVTMLNVYIPPGRTAGYHKHSTDYAYVFVEAAKTKVQVLGEQPVEREPKPGTSSLPDTQKSL